MLLFLFLSFDLQYGAFYARATIITSLALALASLVLSLRQPAEPVKTAYTEEELAAMGTPERASAIEAMDRAKTPFFSRDVSLITAVSFGGVFLWEYASFLYVSFASLLTLFLVNRQPKLQSVMVAAGIVCAIQYVFGNLFQIPLPSPEWWSIY
jgi:hypothetical protein